MLTPVEMSRIRIFVHADFVDDVLKQLATLGAVDISDIRSSLGEFQGLLQPLEPSELLFRASSIQVRASSLIESLGHSVEEASAYEPRWMSAEELEKAESWLSEVEAELSKVRSEAGEDQQALSQALQQLFSKYGEKLLSLYASLDAMRKIEEAKVKMGRTKSVVVFEGRAKELFWRARFGLICSGTATLEAALCGLPHVIMYRAGRINVAIAKRLARVNWIGLPNLIAQKQVVPELIQQDATPQRMAGYALKYLRY